MRTAAEYTALVTPLHAKRARFIATLEALIRPLSEAQAVLETLPAKFDVDEAEAAQLDAVGLWVGVSRLVQIPLENVFFAFDDEALGLDLANWKGPFEADVGLFSLDDFHFRTLVRAKIAANSWDGTGATVLEVLSLVFPNNYVVVEDKQDMTMNVALAGPPLTVVTRALLSGGYLPFKPMGVEVRYFVASDPGPIFAFDVPDGLALAGLDSGSFAIPA